MTKFSKALLISLSLGVAGMAGGCTSDQPAPSRPPPHPILRPPMVGGPCSYTDHPGIYTVTKVDGAAVHFSFQLSAVGPANGPPAGNDLVGTVAPAPAVGQTFPGALKQEVHGTCSPWVYSLSIGGTAVMLEPAS
jgi:hypothetical protein